MSTGLNDIGKSVMTDYFQRCRVPQYERQDICKWRRRQKFGIASNGFFPAMNLHPAQVEADTPLESYLGSYQINGTPLCIRSADTKLAKANEAFAKLNPDKKATVKRINQICGLRSLLLGVK